MTLMQSTPPSPVLQIQKSLDEDRPLFTMEDFRLFNHFLNAAYPHVPVGNESIWTHEIPSLSSDYDFLLHAMLALSASDLADTSPSPSTSIALKSTALSYRIKAITSLNLAISQPITSAEKGNAMLATCYNLLLQSVLIEDGLIEYMTFIRGTIAVSIHMGINHIKFLFQHMFNQEEIAEAYMKDLPLIQPDLAHECCRSLENICNLVTNPREVEYYSHLLSAARNLFTSSSDGNTPHISSPLFFLHSH
jgi:hypothetical protein